MSIPDGNNHPVARLYYAFFETKFFPDLVLLTLWLIGSTWCIYLPILQTSPVRLVFSIPLVLFIPGYALIASLFPGSDDLDLMERVVLSSGLSVAVVPLAGLCLNYSPLGIHPDSVVVSITLLTFMLIVAGQYRRALLPEDRRFMVPARTIYQQTRDGLFPRPGSRVERLLSVILLVSVIVALTATLYYIAIPREGERFTEFYILGEKKMAADYPDRMISNKEYQLYIGVGNHEKRNTAYMIETYLLSMEYDMKTKTSSISRMMRIGKIPVILEHNQSVILPCNLSSPDSGYNRVEFLLFNESVPENDISGWDRINASYRDLHLWIRVSDLKT